MPPPTRSRTVPARVVLALGAATIVLGGCGTHDAAPTTGRTATTGTTPPSASSLALQERAEEVFRAFDGTEEQREANGRLRAWNANGAMDTCMAAEGFPEWDWSTASGPPPRSGALVSSVFFAAPLDHAASDALRDSVRFIRDEEGLQSGEPPAEQEPAISRCAGRTSGAGDGSVRRRSEPRGADRLREQWWAMVRDWDSLHGDVRAYDACFAAGAPDLEVSEDVGGWRAELVRRAPRAADVPPPGSDEETFSQPWRDFLALEARLEGVDWSCRGEVYEAHHAEVARDVESFARAQATQISAVAEEWGTVVHGAATLPDPLGGG